MALLGNGTEDIPIPGDPGFIPALIISFTIIAIIMIVMRYWYKRHKI